MTCLSVDKFLQWAESDVGTKPTLPQLCLPPQPPNNISLSSDYVSVQFFSVSEGGSNQNPSIKRRYDAGTGLIKFPLTLERIEDYSPPPHEYYQEDAFVIISEGGYSNSKTAFYRDGDGNPVSFSWAGGAAYNIKVEKPSKVSKVISVGRNWTEITTLEGTVIFPPPGWDSGPTPTPTPTPTPPPCDVPIRNDFEGGFFCLSFSEYNNLINQIDNIEQLLRTYNP